MKWASALSQKADLEEAVRECAAAAQAQLGAPAELAVLFLSEHFRGEYDDAPKLVDRLLHPRHLIGCSAGGVIGAGREVEHQPALSLFLGSLPGVRLSPFHLEADSLPDMDAPPGAWAQCVGITDRRQRPDFLILADPFTFNPEDLARGLDYAFPDSVKVGGLSSGAAQPGDNRLFLDGSCHRSGAVGLACTGDIRIDPIVAQGCRPIGKPMRVTACHQNQLLRLDDRPALKAVELMLEGLGEEDRQLARTSLFLGVLTDPLKPQAARGDYLIRNLIGLDARQGTLAVGALLRPGQTVQFHLRDKRSSSEDLRKALSRYAASKPAPPPSGALLFSCLGRGRHLYGVSNHDTEAFLKQLGPLPIGGFFCNGEIGPVDGATQLHGYTSCFGVLRPASKS